MTREITPEMIESLDTLREAVAHSDEISNRLARVFNVLDNAGYFATIDGARDDREAEASRISVTVREVPGGWAAYQDDDRTRKVAEAGLYDDIEKQLRALPVLVYVAAVLMTEEEN